MLHLIPVAFCLLLHLAQTSGLGDSVSVSASAAAPMAVVSTMSADQTTVSATITRDNVSPTTTSSTPLPSMPTSATKTTEEREEGEDSGLSAGTVAGIVVGVVVGVAAAGGVGVLVTVLIVKAVKGSGGKVSPMKKGDAGRDPVKTDKQPLVETLPKPE